MNLQLVEGWAQFYKMWSVWSMVILAILPDAFNAAIELGLLDEQTAPSSLAYTIKVIAFIGVVVRLIKQKSLETQVEA